MVKVKVDKNGGLIITKDLVVNWARTIEESLSAFGIIVRVVEINSKVGFVEFCVELALGTPIEEIIKHRKDVAMALASITGDVEIEAPIPGRSLIALRLPIDKKWKITFTKETETVEDALKKVRKLNNEPAEDKPLSVRQMFSTCFYLIAAGFEKIGNLINKK
jgi:hypothetical protein